MGLTAKESSGAVKILKLLPQDELLSLAKTVTRGQISITSVDEAVRAVISYTENPAELLRRKKIRREVLFKYAHDEHIQVMPSEEKLVLIQRILRSWGSGSVSADYLAIEDGEDIQLNRTASSVQQSGQALSFHNNAVMAPNIELLRGSSNARSTNAFQMPDVVTMTSHDYNFWNDGSLKPTSEDQQMAVLFSQWFYQRLNANAIIPSDLFADAVLHLCVVNCDHHGSIERFDGSELIARRLGAFVVEEQLIFNPNATPDGVRGMSDPHGRRVIFVCGTVHKGDRVLGLFEQQFGLVRDPTAENNWKIRSTRLALSTTAPSVMPTLEVTQTMLTSHANR